VDATVVFGINDSILTSDMTVISNASCTTNCMAPVAKVLSDAVGIENGLMTTIHSYTNDQRLSDVFHSDLYRARAAALNMIPTKTGAAALVGKIVPALEGKFDGMAVRVPTANVSLVDLTFTASKDVTADAINKAITDAIATDRHLAKVLDVNVEPLVSSDYNHNSFSSIFDATQTRARGRLVKVMSWYDNEWGFSNRMLDNTVALMNARQNTQKKTPAYSEPLCV
jgi:glyceraldehyde 3-phosphate dehydrogenase